MRRLSDNERNLLAKNLGSTILIVLPAASVLTVLYGGQIGGDFSGPVGWVVLIYLVALFPVAVGSLVHSWLLVQFSRKFRIRRIAVMVSSPILLGALPILVDPRLLWELRLPVSVALVLYSFAVRLPDAFPEPGSGQVSDT
jgi:hypothetical protein